MSAASWQANAAKNGWSPMASAGGPDDSLVRSAKTTIIVAALACALVLAVVIVKRGVGKIDPATGKRAASGIARPLMGLTIVVVILQLLAQKAPRLAAQFAALIAVTVFLKAGPIAFGSVSAAFRSSAPGKIASNPMSKGGAPIVQGATAGAALGTRTN